MAGRLWLPDVRLEGLGLSASQRYPGVLEIMSATAAFSPEGIERVLTLSSSDVFEDVGWRRASSESGLLQRVRQ